MVRKYNTNFSRLQNLILDMSEDQQAFLLKQAVQILEQRKKPRNPCLIPVHYDIMDSSYLSFILNINDSGVLIETSDRFPVGRTIKLSFCEPSSRRFKELIGEIAWSDSYSIGVQLDGFPSHER
jgi:hypothetical protein